MHDENAVPIALPTSEEYIFAFHISFLNYDLETARRVFGPSPFQAFVDGLGDADYWAFTYPCGLKLLYEFIHPLVPTSEGIGNVYGDLPEFTHGSRHIPFPSVTIHQSNAENNRLEFDHLKRIEPWASRIAALHDYQVWHQGNDGNTMPVGQPTSKRDARCWVKELRTQEHKQKYWYTKCNRGES